VEFVVECYGPHFVLHVCGFVLVGLRGGELGRGRDRGGLIRSVLRLVAGDLVRGGWSTSSFGNIYSVSHQHLACLREERTYSHPYKRDKSSHSPPQFRRVN
jgi:hypothetical protein